MAVIKFKDAAGNWQTLPSAGPAGKSAYELAVSQGYTGTLEEWLATLHGGNDNLLINGYFRAPVNQRRTPSGSAYSTVGGHVIDRWVLNYGTVTPTIGTGLTLAPGTRIGQLIERQHKGLLGRQCTASLLLANDSIKTTQITFPSVLELASSHVYATVPDVGEVGVGFAYRATAADIAGENAHYIPYFNVTAADKTVTIAAVKLELGTASTLAQDPPVDYGAELMRCLRYALAYDTIERVRACVCSTNYIDFHVATPVPLRIVPSIEQNTMKIIPLNGGTAVDGFAFSILGRTASYLRVRATKTAHGLTDAVLELASVGTRTVFTADL